jgi:hypothetical protein
MRETERIPEAHFGPVKTTTRINWRAKLRDLDEPDDDEELSETPLDIVGMLGFDPKDLWSNEKISKGGSGSGNFDHSGRPGSVGGSGDVLAFAETGKSITVTLHRGEGAVDSRVPSQFGIGQYWTPNEEVAGTYGPNVRQETFEIKNPYVWDLKNKQDYMTEMKNEFGTKNSAAFTQQLQAKGHDALIVRGVPYNRQSHTNPGEYKSGRTTEVVWFGIKKYSRKRFAK